MGDLQVVASDFEPGTIASMSDPGELRWSAWPAVKERRAATATVPRPGEIWRDPRKANFFVRLIEVGDEEVEVESTASGRRYALPIARFQGMDRWIRAAEASPADE